MVCTMTSPSHNRSAVQMVGPEHYFSIVTLIGIICVQFSIMC